MMAAVIPTDDWSDRDLLELWRRSQPAPEAHRAGRILFDRHKAVVTRFFLGKGCGGDPADLVTQTFAELFRGREHGAIESFRGFLMTIAVRVFYAHLRKRSKRNREVGDFAEVCLARLVEASPSSGVHRRHALERVAIALRQIPLQSQLLIELKYFAELSDPEVAMALEIPPTTLPGRHRRAIGELRRAALPRQ